MNFNGQRILVTGAGKGIGRDTAIHLAQLGARVIALSRDPADLATLADACGCDTLAVDLADAQATVQAAMAALPVDLLVNCAGIAPLAAFVDTPVADFDRTIAVNTRAPMLVSQVVVRDLIRRGVGGSIVNVSSIAADIGLPLHTA